MASCRYAVVYRLLHGVLLIVVSRSHANVFSNLNLVAAISRLLVAELKSVEITPERVIKKYAQVCSHMGCKTSRVQPRRNADQHHMLTQGRGVCWEWGMV